MTNVLIIGATSLVGQKATKYFLNKTDDHLTLMARNPGFLSIDKNRGRVVQGDVLDDIPLDDALDDIDIVVITADSNLALSAERIIGGMDKHGVDRLIFITSMGLYNEVPVTDGASGNLTNQAILKPYQAAVQAIESSDLNYTIVRPSQFDESQDLNYEVVPEGEAGVSGDVSLNSVADFIIKAANNDKVDSHESVAICRKEA
ncbi:NAD(P)H-binding protein [Companilactobacillus halodurans]|uniref:NAD-dependent epimerase/dehydratase family protein n=1 Tax=Companilactobacillus halodurans TaxID=2584183 RepID=A0A5P0ZSD5_9LACO|nr:NAD(P)H-binding protein [Companilactobacillus halodurans]MQS76969.1 NAD-dependent epimerase/dehydratase family protein [Companilactobacillus halodurans]MQS96389.1 NAD-dependent epimerase/dehydratase family protein [Companilactobacillus halodurans]